MPRLLLSPRMPTTRLLVRTVGAHCSVCLEGHIAAAWEMTEDEAAARARIRTATLVAAFTDGGCRHVHSYYCDAHAGEAPVEDECKLCASREIPVTPPAEVLPEVPWSGSPDVETREAATERSAAFNLAAAQPWINPEEVDQ